MHTSLQKFTQVLTPSSVSREGRPFKLHLMTRWLILIKLILYQLAIWPLNLLTFALFPENQNWPWCVFSLQQGFQTPRYNFHKIFITWAKKITISFNYNYTLSQVLKIYLILYYWNALCILQSESCIFRLSLHNWHGNVVH